MRRTAGWTVQALLACCALFGAATAAKNVGITSLRWYTESPEMLLCADAVLADGELRLLVYTEGIGQSDYVGSRSDENCATFNVYFPYSGLQNTFGFLVVDGSDQIIQQGETIFTLVAEEFFCGQSRLARITSGFINSSTEAWACLPDYTVCYAEAPGEVCIGDLDPVNNPELLVCVPMKFSNVSTIELDRFEAEILRYSYENSSGILNISYTTLPSTRLAELVSRVDEEFSMTVGSCENDQCTLEPFFPSTSNYSLCGVFLDNTYSVSSVGATTFQDFLLTVDETNIPIVFHLTKVSKQQMYEIYHGTNVSSVFDNGPVDLDCTEVPGNNFCYGVVYEEADYIAVSYENRTNSIVTPVFIVENLASDSMTGNQEKSASDTEVIDSEVEADDKPAVRVDTKADETKAEIASGYMKKWTKALNAQNPGIKGQPPRVY